MAITKTPVLVFLVIFLFHGGVVTQRRNVGNFQEVFAWKQLIYNLDGNLVLQDRFVDDVSGSRSKRGSGVVFRDNQQEDGKPWNQERSSNKNSNGGDGSPVRPADEEGRFFIQYNNVPMGVELVGERIFITVPRRRYGIPSTLNYIDVRADSNNRSPPLRPYPNLRQSRELISVYRTRADKCGRLWMVDTGLLEIPDAPQQVQAPAIVVYDLNSDQQILRYQFKESDIPAANTPTGLASITVDITGNCADAYAYVPDLTTFGLIVFSLRDGDSWRLTHNYFYLSPTAGNYRIAGESFQWSDGIFSLTMTEPDTAGCRAAYFHPLSSFEEFSVSTCVLKNKTASSDSDFWTKFSKVGNRGEGSQSTMHGYHGGSRVVFFAEVGRDSISCWNSGQMLAPGNVEILARDSQRMSYPSDLHVTGDEVWVMANTLPRFGYSVLDTNEYNFYVYRGYVNNLITGTVCDSAMYRYNR